jgi:hypothetical protein
MDTHHQHDVLSVREAARELGVVPDYVARLCREGAVKGERKGRAWMVDRNSLRAYRVAQMEKKEGWRRELSHRRQEEYRKDRAESPSTAFAPTSNSARIHNATSRSNAQQHGLRSIIASSTLCIAMIRRAAKIATAGTLLLLFIFVLLESPAGVRLQEVTGVHNGLEQIVKLHTRLASTSVLGGDALVLSGGTAYTAGVFDGLNAMLQGAAEWVYESISGMATRQLKRADDETIAGQVVDSDTMSDNVLEEEDAAASSVVLTPPPTLPLPSVTPERVMIVDADVVHERDVSVSGDIVGNGNVTIAGSGIFSGAVRGGQATFTGVTTGNVTATGNITATGDVVSSGTVVANGGLVTNGADIDAGSGLVFASNILSSITAGRNVRIDTSDPQNPVISVRNMSSSVTIPDVGEVLTGTAGQLAFYESGGRVVSATGDIVLEGGNVYVGTSTSAANLYVANGFFQDDMPDCQAADETLQYNADTGKFFCGSDAGANEGVVDLYDDGVVAANGIRSMNFTDHFVVSGVSAVPGAADVAIDYAGSGITRSGENEEITGEWEFSTGTTTVLAADIDALQVDRFFQDGFTADCSGEGSTVLYNPSTGKFSCGNDESGTGTAVSVIKEEGVTMVAPSLSLNFKGIDFVISTSSTSTEADIAIDYASSTITRGNQDETIAGQWTFTNTLTADLLNITEQHGTSTLRNVNISRMLFAGEYFSDLTGNGLVASSGVLQVAEGVPNKIGTADDQILAWNNTLREWVVVGIGDVGGGLSLFTELQDAPDVYIASAIPFAATSTDELLFDAGFTFNPDTDELTVVGDMVAERIDTSGGSTSTFAGIDTTGLVADFATTSTLRVGAFYQAGLTNCDESGTVLYNATTGTFSCGTDAGHTGAVGFLENNNVEVVSGVFRIDFSGDFTVATDTIDTTEGDISINYAVSGITRSGENETITALWDFNQLLTAPSFVATSTTATSTFAGNVQIDGVASTTSLYTSAFFQEGFGAGTCDGQNGKVIYDPTTGKFGCGFDGGSVTAQAVWATSSDNTYIYPADPNDIVVVGANSTTTTDSMLEVVGKITADELETTATATLAIANIQTAIIATGTIQAFFQNGLGDCTGTGSNVQYNPATGKFYCGIDESGDGTAVNVIKEGDVSKVPGNGGATSIAFEAEDFNVVARGTSNEEGLISIDYASSTITRGNQNETIGGSWTFEQLLSAPRFVMSSTTATSTFSNVSITAMLLGSDYVTALTGAGLQIVNGALSLETYVPQVAGTNAGDLLWWDTGSARWATTSTSTLGITLETIAGILAVEKGGTGTTTPPAVGEILIGDGAGGYTFTTIGGLGVGDGNFIGLDDTPEVYIASAIPFAATSTNELLFDTGFTFNGDTKRLTVGGDIYTNTIYATTGTSTFVGIDADAIRADHLSIADFFQDGFGNCKDDNQTVLYNSETGQFFCGTDSGADGGVVTITEAGGSNFSLGGALGIDFDGSDFELSSSSSFGVVEIDYMNSGITRKTQDELITGSWEFSSTLDADLLSVASTSGTSTLNNIQTTAITMGDDVVTDFVGSGLEVTNGVLGVGDNVPNIAGSAEDDILLWNGTSWGTSTLAAAGSVTTFVQLTDTIDDLTTRPNGILFIDAVGDTVTASTNFLYDSTRDMMVIGTSTLPDTNTEVLTVFRNNISGANGLRLAWDGATYMTLKPTSLGALEIESSNTGLEAALELGDGTSKDASVRFFGDTRTYYFGQDDTDNALKIGQGTEVGTSTYVTITEMGNVGIGTVSNTEKLAVAGDVSFDASAITLASSSASLLTVNYETDTENIIVDNAPYAWSIGTTSAHSILNIDTSGTSSIVSVLGGFDVQNGALRYDADNDVTVVSLLEIGNARFAENTSGGTWMDVPVNADVADGTVMKYSAQLDSNPFFTLWSKALSGGVTNRIAVVGDLPSDADLGNGNLPDGSFIVTDGALCVGDGGASTRYCTGTQLSGDGGGSRQAGAIYAVGSKFRGVDLAEDYPTKDETLGVGEVVMLSSTDPVFVGRHVATASNTPAPFGVVSTEPGIVLGGFGREDRFAEERHVPVALAGRVPVNVTLEGGAIAIGDHLTVSKTQAGKATKLTGSGYSIGVALEEYTAASASSSVLVFVDTQYVFDEDTFYVDATTGNVGIGTTTPQYALQVVGDVGAEAFVNVSTRGMKRDIADVEAERRLALLGDLYTMAPVEYHYNSEEDSAPLRLGFIAEDAPESILSVDEKGVDLYKLSALTVLGVQNVDERLRTVEVLLGISVDDIASSTAEEDSDEPQGLVALILHALKEFGITISEGLASFVGLETEELTVGSSTAPTGIQLYDEATGEPYCVYVRNGVLREQKGRCGSSVPPTPSDDGVDETEHAQDEDVQGTEDATNDDTESGAAIEDVADTDTESSISTEDDAAVDSGEEVGATPEQDTGIVEGNNPEEHTDGAPEETENEETSLEEGTVSEEDAAVEDGGAVTEEVGGEEHAPVAEEEATEQDSPATTEPSV